MTRQNKTAGTPGLVVLFGSGEMSPTGRKIHEDIFKQLQFQAPVKVGILETPTGFEVNAIHGWPARMQTFFEESLRNYKPEVARIRAWRRDGQYSTNDAGIVDRIGHQDYLYCGAGSPGYTVKHLANTRAYDQMIAAWKSGMTLCLGSATAVAISRFALPVYEIFKAGAELHWIDGLNLFSSVFSNLAIVPHWNNQEGEDFDTTHCWMGASRFEKLKALLPPDAVILGIDEQTACVVDMCMKEVRIVGVGNAYVHRKGEKRTYKTGEIIPFSDLG